MHPPAIGVHDKSAPLHVNATIDVKYLTGDILAVDNQVTDCASYLLRGTNATQGNALENGLLLFTYS